MHGVLEVCRPTPAATLSWTLIAPCLAIYYPQSNGKIERWHRAVKSTAIRVKNPNTLEGACKVLEDHVQYYNEKRLHSAIGYVTPKDKMEGREKTICQERDRKLEAARERRSVRRAAGSVAA